MVRFLKLFFPLAILAAALGCGSKIPPGNPEYAKARIKLVAVLPVKNNTGDTKAAPMLRQKVLDELYFKGYPKVPLNRIDEKLAPILHDHRDRGDIPPQTLGELLGVDAVMYCTLRELKISSGFFYSPLSVSADFEMRNAKTGTTLWRAQIERVFRNFGYGRNNVEMKVIQVYESALQEIVDKALEKLPDGPELPG